MLSFIAILIALVALAVSLSLVIVKLASRLIFQIIGVLLVSFGGIYLLSIFAFMLLL